MEEPILKENKDRFVLFPIKHREFWDIYKKAESNFWMIKDVHFKDDIQIFSELPKEEGDFIRFAGTLLQDRFNKDLDKRFSNFINQIQYPEARCMLGFQTMTYNVHAEIYSAYYNDFLIEHDFNLVNSEVLKEKEKWIDKNFNENTSFAKKLIVFTAVQRILYSSVFAGISKHIYRTDLFSPMLLKFIYDDEGLFTDFAVTVFFQLKNKISEDEAYTILKEATEIEFKMIEEFYPYYEKIGIDKRILIKFARYNANILYTSLFGHLIYDNSTKNPCKNLNWDRSYVIVDPNKPEYKEQERIFSYADDF